MELRGEQVLLRVYLRSTDQYHFAPVYERVVQKAAAAKLAGATVLRGILGFGGGRVPAPFGVACGGQRAGDRGDGGYPGADRGVCGGGTGGGFWRRRGREGRAHAREL